MLSINSIIKVWAQPVPDRSHQLGILRQETTQKTSWVLGNRQDPETGDVTIVQYNSEEEMLADPDYLP